MFSSQVINVIAKSLKFMDYTQSIPVKWDDQKNTMTTKNTILTWICSRLFLLYNISYVIYLINQLVLTLRHPDLKVMDIYWITVMLYGHSVSCEGLLNPILMNEDWVTFYRQVVLFDGKLDDLKIPDIKRRRRMGELLGLYLCKANVLIAVSFCAFSAMVYLYNPRAPQYPFARWPWPEGMLAYVIFAAMEIYTKCVVMPWGVLIHAWITVAVALETTAITLIRKCRDPLSKRILYFRCIYLINTFHNVSYLPTLIPMRLLFFGLFGLQGAVVLVRFRDRIAFVEFLLVLQFGIAMLICGLLFLNVAGGIYKNSTGLAVDMQKGEGVVDLGLETRNEANKNKFTRRILKSLKPFGVSCGPTRAFTYNSMLEFFVLVASGVTTILVNLRERDGDHGH